MTACSGAKILAKTLLAVAAGLLAMSSAHAASQVFYADSTTALTPNEARELFLMGTTDIKSEGFESSPTGIPSGSLAVFGASGELAQPAGASGAVKQGAQQNNRFNTTLGCNILTACKWWETAFNFELTLGSKKSAFAFFATDLGDKGGAVSLDFWNDTIKVRSGVAVTQPSVTGELLFFGFIDDAFVFDHVTVNVQQVGANPTFFDYVGFDDVLAGVRAASGGGGTVPEPASWALVAISLGVLAATRRGERSATRRSL